MKTVSLLAGMPLLFSGGTGAIAKRAARISSSPAASRAGGLPSGPSAPRRSSSSAWRSVRALGIDSGLRIPLEWGRWRARGTSISSGTGSTTGTIGGGLGNGFNGPGHRGGSLRAFLFERAGHPERLRGWRGPQRWLHGSALGCHQGPLFF
jgi:hypothetical protein